MGLCELSHTVFFLTVLSHTLQAVPLLFFSPYQFCWACLTSYLGSYTGGPAQRHTTDKMTEQEATRPRNVTTEPTVTQNQRDQQGWQIHDCLPVPGWGHWVEMGFIYREMRQEIKKCTELSRWPRGSTVVNTGFSTRQGFYCPTPSSLIPPWQINTLGKGGAMPDYSYIRVEQQSTVYSQCLANAHWTNQHNSDWPCWSSQKDAPKSRSQKKHFFLTFSCPEASHGN